MNNDKLEVKEVLTLAEGSESVHVRTTVFADFEAAIDASLEQLVARWLPYASPRAVKGDRSVWGR